jgi:hypothetical protein
MCRYKFRRPNGTPINALAETVLRTIIPDYERKRCETLAIIEKYLSEDRYKRSGRFKRISRWITDRLRDTKYCLLNDLHSRGMLTESELRYAVDNTSNIRYMRLADGTEIVLHAVQDTDSMRNFIESHRTRLTPANIIYLLVFHSQDDVRGIYDTYYQPGAADTERVPYIASRVTDIPSFSEWLETKWQAPDDNDSDDNSSDTSVMDGDDGDDGDD